MEKKVDKKFSWVIKDFYSLQSEDIYSDIFVVGGCKWHLIAYPKGYEDANFLALYLQVPDHESLPSGWRRNTRLRFIVVNQHSEKLSRQRETQQWFDEETICWGFPSMLSLNKIHAKDSGFLVNGELKIIVEIDLLEIIGKVDVNGFHLLPSHVEFVSRMFEKHPEIASEFRLKNPNLRTSYMNLLLSLIETLRQPFHELPKDDLEEANFALEQLTNAGFKLDWLKKTLVEKAREIRIQEIEMELKDLEAELEKEKSEALAAKALISFDNII